MKSTELRKQSVSELQKQLVKIRQELIESRRSLAAGELVNPRVITSTRKTIARIETLLKEAALKESVKEDA